MIGLERLDEALSLLERGFDTCPCVCLLCEGLARLYETINRIEQFGWLMQACFVGSENYYTYLRLSHAADHCTMHDIATFLKRESDWLTQSSKGWVLADEEDAAVKRIVAANMSETRAAFESFAVNLARMRPVLFVPGTQPGGRKRGNNG